MFRFRLLPGALAPLAHTGLLLLLMLVTIAVFARGASANEANEALMRSTVEGFLLERTADEPGRVELEINLNPTAASRCRQPEAFLPGSGGALRGRTTVGVRCPGDAPRTRYFQAYIRVFGEYPVLTRDLSPGETLQASDLSWQEGDLTRLSSRLITDSDALIGQVAQRRLTADRPLQAGMVRAPLMVRQGEEVTILAPGTGFVVTGSGRALNSAGRGESVRVRTQSNAIVNGVAKREGVVTLR